MPAVLRSLSKVLIGPQEVAGIAQGLQQGLAGNGIASELVLECQHPFGYAADESSSLLVHAWKSAGTLARRIPTRKLWLKAPVYAWHLALGWPVLCWALARFDAFVFLSGKTLTNTPLELWLMRMLGKPVVVIFLGSDARPAYINGAWPASTAAALHRKVRRQKRKVRWLERLATACVNAPGTSHFHERPVINWFAFGLPRTTGTQAAPGVRQEVDSPGACPAAFDASRGRSGVTSDPLRLVHSPSNPVVKGTAQIQATVERLQQRGFNLEFVALKGVSNEQVLASLRRCDLLVDQLYSDTPMAGLATEAALLGKPALVGGYFAREMPEALGGMPMPPTRFVDPDLFEQALEELVNSASARAALATAASNFVQTEWSCDQVASRLLRILRGEASASWWFDPANVKYLAGCGLSEDAARERVRQLIDHAGVGALQLADKPVLEEAFQSWARIPAPVEAKFSRGPS